MPTYQIDVEKLYNNEYWTNVYYVGPNLLSLDDAVQAADSIVAFERAIHFDVVTFTKYRASTIVPGDIEYRTIILNVPGNRVSTGNTFLPLFNVVRCDLTDEGFKRPERKYYRLPVAEADQADGVLGFNVGTLIDDAWTTQIQGNSVPLVGPNGEAIIDLSVFPNVGMRQLRRGSRRRTTPVI